MKDKLFFKFVKENIVRILFSAYIIFSGVYLFLVGGRGIFDFLCLLIPPVMWLITKKLSLKSKLIILTASFIVIFFGLSSNELEDTRYYCYNWMDGSFVKYRSEEMSYLEPDKLEERYKFWHSQLCTIRGELRTTFFVLLTPVIPVSIITILVLLVWKNKKTKANKRNSYN